MTEEGGKEPDLSTIRCVHLVGVAGSGLSGLASLFLSAGVEVSGSESQDSPTLRKLENAGVRCAVGHDGANVGPRTELVVASAAIAAENPELVAARSRGIAVLKYSQCLGALMGRRTGIGIAGTHGKTTTTAMVASALTDAGRDPGFLIGGEYPGLGGASRWGTGELFVAEACEFDRSFHRLQPVHAIVTNIEEDHLDYFMSLEEIREAFGVFARLLPPGGTLVLNRDDPNSRHLPAWLRGSAVSFSLRSREGDWWADEMAPQGGGIRFRARSGVGESARVALKVPGVHNVKNALATIALLRRLGLSLAEVVKGIETFTGVSRRFEILLRDPVVVIDDYAHHPTEIEAVLRAARETFAGRRIRMIFQPHQHSRTRRFLAKFAEILAAADESVVAEVYHARDSIEEVRQVSASVLAAEIRRLGGHVVCAPRFPEILDHLRRTLVRGEVIVCLGAGDITLLARRLAAELADGPSDRLPGGLEPRAELLDEESPAPRMNGQKKGQSALQKERVA